MVSEHGLSLAVSAEVRGWRVYLNHEPTGVHQPRRLIEKEGTRTIVRQSGSTSQNPFRSSSPVHLSKGWCVHKSPKPYLEDVVDEEWDVDHSTRVPIYAAGKVR